MQSLRSSSEALSVTHDLPATRRGSQACKAGKPAGSDFGYGGPLTELALLGMIAVRFKGQKLEWNAAAMKFSTAPQRTHTSSRPFGAAGSVGADFVNLAMALPLYSWEASPFICSPIPLRVSDTNSQR